MSQSDYESTVDDSRGGRNVSSKNKSKSSSRNKGGERGVGRTHESSYETEDEDDETAAIPTVNDKSSGRGKNADMSSGSDPSTMLTKQPLASSFAKRCYFTKQGIGGITQHYEGLTLTGNVVLMLAAAMKLKGCPTICDEEFASG